MQSSRNLQAAQYANAASTRRALQRRSFPLFHAWALVVAIAAVIGLLPTPAAAQDYGWPRRRGQVCAEQANGDRAGCQHAAAAGTRTLVFPDITKAGFLVGGEYGNGVLFRRGGVAGYYDLSAVSYGFQAGAQTFGYALFFMNESAWRALNSTDGLQVGVGPSVVVLDEGTARSITSATLTSDVYAFVFGQQGLMAGAGLQGTKITRLNY